MNNSEYITFIDSVKMMGGGSSSILHTMKETLPISPDIKSYSYFKDRINKLISFDEIRIMELFEIVQYGSLYLIITFIAGVSLDFLFPKYDDKKDTKALLIEVFLQSILLIISAFYVRKIVKLFPFMSVINIDLNGDGRIPKYRPYESTEYMGEMMMSVIFISVQINMLRKVNELSARLHTWIYNKEPGLSGKL